MAFRTLVSSFLLLTTSIFLQAQSTEEIFERDIASFMDGTVSGDFETVLDMTYPKLFDLISRDQMQQMLSSVLNNPEMKMSISVDSIQKIYEPLVEGAETFRRIDYISVMRMNLGDELWKEKGAMVEGMQVSMPTANVTIEDATQSLLINQLSSMIAIQAEGSSNWKYLQFQPNQLVMLKSLIPESIVDQMFETK